MKMGGIIKHSLSLSFILGGKSFVTFLNTKTQNRFTFKVVKHKKEDIFFVNVLTLPDIYTFIGSIINNTFYFSNKSKFSCESQSVKVFDFVISKLKNNTLSDIIEIWHEGKCGKCGKRLTVPTSIETGFGPDCYRMMRGVNKQVIRDKKINLILNDN